MNARVLTAGLAVATVAITGLSTAGQAATAVGARQPTSCPAVYPLAQVHPGMVGYGYTTVRGTTPSRFHVLVYGILHNAVAPGIDMVVIRADSAAISRVGGIWEGMSGSPIYASDGRLIGALAYGMTFGTTRAAGVTPALPMYALGRLSTRAGSSHVALSPSLRRTVTADGTVSAGVAAGGMSPLTTPVSVSGLSPTALRGLQATLDATSPVPLRLYAGSSATGHAADVSRVQPGRPIATALAYGGFTFAAIGTVTAVCNGRALAFGHPMQNYGTTTQSAHLARVLHVQREPEGPSSVIATIGGQVGTVVQDRLPGILARLGRMPKHVTTVVAVVRGPSGIKRVVRSHTTMPDWVAPAAVSTTYGGVFGALEKDTSGRAWLRWTVTGHRADGSRWTFSRTDRAATQWGIPDAVTAGMYDELNALTSNTFEDVTVDRVNATVRVDDVYSSDSLTKLRVRRGAHYVLVTPDRVVTAHPGQRLSLRARLDSYRHREPAQFVTFDVTVPKAAVGSGTFTITGGADMSAPDLTTATSFDDLLTLLTSVPRKDRVYDQVSFSDAAGAAITGAPVRARADRIVSGSVTLQVNVSP